jgi:hypothetical protein
VKKSGRQSETDLRVVAGSTQGLSILHDRDWKVITNKPPTKGVRARMYLEHIPFLFWSCSVTNVKRDSDASTKASCMAQCVRRRGARIASMGTKAADKSNPTLLNDYFFGGAEKEIGGGSPPTAK